MTGDLDPRLDALVAHWRTTPPVDEAAVQAVVRAARGRRTRRRATFGVLAAATLAAVLLGPRYLRPAGVEFVLRAPAASEVSVVGSFNDWDPARTRMQFDERRGVWRVVLPLPAGAYTYSYIADGRWLPDPVQPRLREDEFGRPSSIRIVRSGRT